MLNCKQFYKALKSNQINSFFAVPDSLLKNFLNFLDDNVKSDYTLAHNEGGAVAMAVGHYLSTNDAGLVILQNSGLSHILNPIISLAKPYKVPLLLMIGWRGEPGKKDAPQHLIQGEMTLPLLKAANIPYLILPDQLEEAEKELEKIIKLIKKEKTQYALVVKKGTFEKYKISAKKAKQFELSREQAIQIVADATPPNALVVSTTGKASRELNEHRDNAKQSHDRDFHMVGSMGHAASIAMQVALNTPNKKVFCFDGDAAMIMHMGVLPIIGDKKPSNLVHIIFNNGANDSVGGQDTVAFKIDIPALAKACGYPESYWVDTKKELQKVMKEIETKKGPILIEIKVNKGARKDLTRPNRSLPEIKNAFMAAIKKYDKS